MAATNSDIRARVEQGTFRRDLYYRLSIFVYTLPPLRQRLQDIPLLLGHFLAMEEGSSDVSPQVLELLHCYSWPGNIREFKNVVHHAATHADGAQIVMKHLPEAIVARCPRKDILSRSDLKEKTECFEAHLLAEYSKLHPDPREASERLGIGLRTYYRKLKKHGVEK
jgi:transcriptional regulator with PAS, ATPase and Fis domain